MQPEINTIRSGTVPPTANQPFRWVHEGTGTEFKYDPVEDEFTFSGGDFDGEGLSAFIGLANVISRGLIHQTRLEDDLVVPDGHGTVIAGPLEVEGDAEITTEGDGRVVVV